MRRWSIKTGCLLLGTLAAHWAFGQYTPDSLIRVYEARAERFLVKSPHVKSFYRIDYRGIHIYGGASLKDLDRSEFTLYWTDLALFKQLIRYTNVEYQYEIYRKKAFEMFDSTLNHVAGIAAQNHPQIPIGVHKPLSGLRIALDPGHIAGDLRTAKMEGRFLDMRASNGERLTLFEGELTLSTALLLKDSLEKYGAEVFLTREKGNISALGVSFDEWRKKHLFSYLRQLGYSREKAIHVAQHAPDDYVFQKYFLRLDLETRAEKINAFHPHFTLVLHFNADIHNKGWQRPTQRNYSMVFIPGGYLYHEMQNPRTRFEFLRALVTDNLEESAQLSQHVMEEMVALLGVPAVSDSERVPYLERFSLKVGEGVYARNLRLCSTLKMPLCYGEALMQDNETELRQLAQNDLAKGIIAPRIKQVAQAYFQGILRYVQERQKDREHW